MSQFSHILMTVMCMQLLQVLHVHSLRLAPQCCAFLIPLVMCMELQCVQGILTPVHCLFVSPSLRPELQLDLRSTTEGNSSETFTLGSIITLGKWHHLAINILPCNMQPTYEVVLLALASFPGPVSGLGTRLCQHAANL